MKIEEMKEKKRETQLQKICTGVRNTPPFQINTMMSFL